MWYLKLVVTKFKKIPESAISNSQPHGNYLLGFYAVCVELEYLYSMGSVSRKCNVHVSHPFDSVFGIGGPEYQQSSTSSCMHYFLFLQGMCLMQSLETLLQFCVHVFHFGQGDTCTSTKVAIQQDWGIIVGCPQKLISCFCISNFFGVFKWFYMVGCLGIR